jgi:hypothetical protein
MLFRPPHAAFRGFAHRDVLDDGCHTQLVDKVADGEKHHLLRHTHHGPVVAVGARMDDAVHVQIKVICVISGQQIEVGDGQGVRETRIGCGLGLRCVGQTKFEMRHAPPLPEGCLPSTGASNAMPGCACRAPLGCAAVRGGGVLLRGGNWAHFDVCFFGRGEGATAIDFSPNSGMQASAVTF